MKEIKIQFYENLKKIPSTIMENIKEKQRLLKFKESVKKTEFEPANNIKYMQNEMYRNKVKQNSPY